MKKTKDLQEKIDQFMEKTKKMEEGERLDLSSNEDLSIGIMNLISIEEHLFFTYNKTNDSGYINLLTEVREIRKEALKEIIEDYKGEVWCISKHLLAASMRFMEVGTKALTKGDKKDAKRWFKRSYNLYNLFWGLNLGAINVADIEQGQNKEKIDLISEEDNPEAEASVSIFDKLGKLIQRAIDCCKE